MNVVKLLGRLTWRGFIIAVIAVSCVIGGVQKACRYVVEACKEYPAYEVAWGGEPKEIGIRIYYNEHSWEFVPRSQNPTLWALKSGAQFAAHEIARYGDNTLEPLSRSTNSITNVTPMDIGLCSTQAHPIPDPIRSTIESVDPILWQTIIDMEMDRRTVNRYLYEIGYEMDKTGNLVKISDN